MDRHLGNGCSAVILLEPCSSLDLKCNLNLPQLVFVISEPQLPTLTRLSCRKGFLVVVVLLFSSLLCSPCHSRPTRPHMVTLNLRILICLLCLFCLVFDEGSYKLTSFVCLAHFLLDSDCSHPQASNSNRDAHVYHHSSIISSNFSG